MSKKRLGLGIDALLGDFDSPSPAHSIDIEKIISDADQPRKYFDPVLITELADSIKTHGIIQPILVELVGDSYRIVAGERRYRAAKEAGLITIDVIVKTFSSDQRLEIALLENIQREDLHPIEEAKAYRALLDQSSMTQQELATRLGKSRSYISNSIRLIELPEVIQQATEEGVISAGHARTLLSVEEDSQQESIYKQVVSEKLSVRQTEELVSHVNNAFKSRSGSSLPKKKATIIAQQLSSQLHGWKVLIKGTTEKGTVAIEYSSKNEMDDILKLLKTPTNRQ